MCDLDVVVDEDGVPGLRFLEDAVPAVRQALVGAVRDDPGAGLCKGAANRTVQGDVSVHDHEDPVIFRCAVADQMNRVRQQMWPVAAHSKGQRKAMRSQFSATPAARWA